MTELLNQEQTEEKNDLLKPKNDIVFHALFREENKRITENLISDILKERVKVKTTNLDRHLNIKIAEQKLGIIDLRTVLKDGTNCNIEMQISEKTNENERFLYYWADSYSRQLLRGEEYKELHKTISIIIVDHEIKELNGIEELGIKWQIRDEKTGKRILTKHLEIIIIEIPKAIRQYRKNNTNRISQWMMFFDNPNDKEVLKIMNENKDIKEAVDELTGMSKDEELRRLAELREKGIRDKKAEIDFAINKGKQEEKQIIAKNMLKENVEIDFIQKITGLTEEEIRGLK